MFALLLLLALTLAIIDAHADSIPREAYRYRAELIRESRFAFGLTAPTATFASQIHVESGYRSNICNRIKACGLSQFIPSTARAMARLYKDLSPAQPTNPTWALRALARYNFYNFRLAGNKELTCSQAKRVLAAYNAGAGVLKRKSWPKETQHYVARIVALEPLYISANFGSGSCH